MELVMTNNGAVKGRMTQGAYVWMGIPYAQPPVGGLRFRKPQPPKMHKNTLDASRAGAAAMQCRRKEGPMSEDCLTLNIWSPAADGKKRPVLLFFHGGSFAGGAGSDPEFEGTAMAARGDVVLVTANYRLGVLGFIDFSALDQNFSANCGLYDTLAALKWVYENIEAFGGDPENITVCGQSAGATIASVLATLPEAKPYLSKVIMMSGGPTLLFTKEEHDRQSREFLAFAGITSARELAEMPAARLIELQRGFTAHCGMGAGTFMIVVDGTLVKEFPVPAAVDGAAKNIPMLIGSTREEMSFYFIKPLARRLEVDGIMNAGVGMERGDIKERIVEAYRRYGKRGAAMMLSDMVFRVSGVWYGEACSAHSNVWMYRFDYASPAMKVSRLHAFHSSDVPFVFGNFRAGLGKWMFLFSPTLKKEQALHDEMQGDLFTFVRTGSLPWEKCEGRHTPGKLYNTPCSVGHMIAPDIKELYRQTDWCRRSFAPGVGPLTGT